MKLFKRTTINNKFYNNYISQKYLSNTNTVYISPLMQFFLRDSLANVIYRFNGIDIRDFQ